MAKYKVNVEYKNTYIVEAEDEDEAKAQAWDWFMDCKPDMYAEELEPGASV